MNGVEQHVELAEVLPAVNRVGCEHQNLPLTDGNIENRRPARISFAPRIRPLSTD